MLKLEKKKKSSQYSIRLREKGSFFEKRLIIALSIAFAFHGALLLIFHITPFKSSSSFLFAPVEMFSDPTISSVSSQASFFKEEEETLTPPLSIVPTIDWNLFNGESILSPAHFHNFNSLQKIEEKVWPQWEEPLFAHLQEPRVQLTIFGDISLIPLIEENPFLKEKVSVNFKKEPATLVYDVILDTRTGEIFWYDLIESNSLNPFRDIAEKILLNLRFATTSSRENINQNFQENWITGTLNFVINDKHPDE